MCVCIYNIFRYTYAHISAQICIMHVMLMLGDSLHTHVHTLIICGLIIKFLLVTLLHTLIYIVARHSERRRPEMQVCKP